MISTCITMPMPSPSHSASIAVCQGLLSIESNDSAPSPNVMVAVPMIGNSL